MQHLWSSGTVSTTIRAMMLALGTATTCFVNTAHAVTTQYIHIQQLNLGQAIQQLALQTRISISYDPRLLTPYSSTELKGQFTVDQALKRLLNPHALEAIKLDNGGYSIQAKSKTTTQSLIPQSIHPSTAMTSDVTSPQTAEQAPIQLPTITLSAHQNPNLRTEGSDAYTTTATTASTGLALSLKQTPQSISVITRQQMQDQNLTQLTDVAMQTAGLSVSQAGNIGSDNSPIYARGQQVDNYLLDGVKLLSSYASIFQSQDTAIYDRFEIVRGATGLMTGSGSASASINMVRKKPLEDFKASASLNLGSWDAYRADLDVSSPLNATGSIRGRAVLAYQDSDSYIDRYQELRQVAYVVLESDLSDHTQASLGLSHQNIDIHGIARNGMPSHYSDGSLIAWSPSTSAAAEWSYSKRGSTALFADIEHQLNDRWTLKALGSRTITRSDELVGYAFSSEGIDPITGQGATVFSTRWDFKPIQDLLSINLTGSFDAFHQSHDLILAASYSKSVHQRPSYASWNNDMNWDGTLDNIFQWNGQYPERPESQVKGWSSSDERSQSIFAATRLQANDQLSFLLGARLENWQRKRQDDKNEALHLKSSKEQANGQLIPYLAMSYQLNELWTAYISHTRIFSPQNFKTEQGGYLEPLIGKNSEIGIKAALFDHQLNLSAAVYRAEEDNKAVMIQDVLAPDGRQAYRAESGAKSEGFEIEVAGKLSDTWQVSSSFSHNSSTDQHGERLNTNVPKNMAKLLSRYTLPYLDNALSLGAAARWQSEIYAENIGPKKTRFTQNSYTLLDLMANYKMTDQLSVHLNINNLLNKKYALAAANSYYGAPRHFRVGLKYNW